jgi:hypothetical protein
MLKLVIITAKKFVLFSILMVTVNAASLLHLKYDKSPLMIWFWLSEKCKWHMSTSDVALQQHLAPALNGGLQNIISG